MKTTLCMIAAAAALSVCAPVMAGGDAAAGKEKAMVCFTCHGEDGLANTGSMPPPARVLPRSQHEASRARHPFKIS